MIPYFIIGYAVRTQQKEDGRLNAEVPDDVIYDSDGKRRRTPGVAGFGPVYSAIPSLALINLTQLPTMKKFM
jgi:hypothetical protein